MHEERWRVGVKSESGLDRLAIVRTCSREEEATGLQPSVLEFFLKW